MRTFYRLAVTAFNWYGILWVWKMVHEDEKVAMINTCTVQLVDMTLAMAVFKTMSALFYLVAFMVSFYRLTCMVDPTNRRKSKRCLEHFFVCLMYTKDSHNILRSYHDKADGD